MSKNKKNAKNALKPSNVVENQPSLEQKPDKSTQSGEINHTEVDETNRESAETPAPAPVVTDSEKSEAAPLTETEKEVVNEPVVNENGAAGPLPALHTVENPPKWALEHRKRVANAGMEHDPNAKQIDVTAAAINRVFEDHEKTTLAKLTEAQVMEFVGKKADGIKIEFHYDNDEKTRGFITLKEFDTLVRCPELGMFNFGIDYSKGV